ncbi:MAG: hypothetical protein ACT4O2_15360 [Beijerinckiaceae bacterium]
MSALANPVDESSAEFFDRISQSDALLPEGNEKTARVSPQAETVLA